MLNARRFLTTKASRRNWLFGGLLATCLLMACSDDAPEYAKSNGALKAVAAEPVSGIPFTGEATVEFGNDGFELDFVVCIISMTPSAVASDSRKRAGYPIVKIGTSDPKYTGGTPMNTVSLLFSRDYLEEVWLLDKGEVTKVGKVFTATGTVRGAMMEKQADGNLKSRPLSDDNIRSFKIEAKCR